MTLQEVLNRFRYDLDVLGDISDCSLHANLNIEDFVFKLGRAKLNSLLGVAYAEKDYGILFNLLGNVEISKIIKGMKWYLSHQLLLLKPLFWVYELRIYLKKDEEKMYFPVYFA